MKFDDLLEVPYKAHGRTKEEGFDCYGLVIECCRRAGTPLADLDYSVSSLPDCEAAKYAKRMNVRQIPCARPGALVEMNCEGALHLGYMIDRNNVLHMTRRGCKLSCLAACKVSAFYEVTKK
mgnify:CR=1 FL=1